MNDFTPAEKLAELERVLHVRELVYPQSETTRTLAATIAERRKDILRAIADDYQRIVDAAP